MSRTFLSSVALLITLEVNLAVSKSDRRRNLLLIIADDVGFESSVYGNTVIQTPALQWLADNGLTFVNAFTAVSSCSASRSVILTGLPPHQNGMFGLHNDYHNFNSFDKVKSLPQILAKHKLRPIKTGIIGKKHVGPKSVYKFDFEETEENNPVNQVGRNITNMKHLVQKFLDSYGNNSFFLYIAFHDAHRCGHTEPQFGNFCEKFGNGDPGMGSIPDWIPKYYDPAKVVVPYFVPGTDAARKDIAAQYTAVNRMDQGIQLILDEFSIRGLLNNSLIIFSSDNGISFPSGRTNLYDPGMREPFTVFPPYDLPGAFRGQREVDAMVSLSDIMPTALDWFGVAFPRYKLFGRNVQLKGKSILPLLSGGRKRNRHVFKNKMQAIRQRQRWKLRMQRNDFSTIFCSHSLHEISMYYPMRLIRTAKYKLLHNLNYLMPFPIDQDFYLSPTFQDLLNRSQHHDHTFWYKNLTGYYYRSQWELYDVEQDPKELKNLSGDPNYAKTFAKLRSRLVKWMNETYDPWLCSPDGVFEDRGAYRANPQCMPLWNSSE